MPRSSGSPAGAGEASMRLLAHRINAAESLLAQLRRLLSIAHGSVSAGKTDEARELLARGLRAVDAYGKR